MWGFSLKKFEQISLVCNSHLYSQGNKTIGLDTIDFLTEVIGDVLQGSRHILRKTVAGFSKNGRSRVVVQMAQQQHNLRKLVHADFDRGRSLLHVQHTRQRRLLHKHRVSLRLSKKTFARSNSQKIKFVVVV